MAYSTDMKKNMRARILMGKLLDYLQETSKNPGRYVPIGSMTTARFWHKVAEFYPVFEKYEHQIPPAIHTLYQLTLLPNLEQLFQEKVITRETSLKDSKDLVDIYSKKHHRLGRPPKLSKEHLRILSQLDSLQIRFELVQANNRNLTEKNTQLYNVIDNLTTQLKG